MNDDSEKFLHEVFRAQLALYRYHLGQLDNEEAADDLTRAKTMQAVLALRYPYVHCQFHYEWFCEGVQAS